MPHNDDDDEIIVIKIGGSSITNKSKEETLNQDSINWFASLIASCVHPSFLNHTTREEEEEDKEESIKTKKKPKFVVVHGAGSFGHHSAKRYGLQCGKAALLNVESSRSSGDGGSTPERRKRFQMEAISKTRHSVQKLNAAMTGTFLDYGVNAVGISPGVSFPGLRAYGSSANNNLDNQSNCSRAAMELLCESICQSLKVGLLPVIHGDACLLDDNKGGILGGDTIVEGIVGSEKMKESVHKVIFISDVAGVFSSDPKANNDARLIRSLKVDVMTGEITIDDENDVVEMHVSGSSHQHDVTGGLKAKLGAAVTAVKCGKDVIIAKCCSRSAEKFVRGDSPPLPEKGTLITRKL